MGKLIDVIQINNINTLRLLLETEYKGTTLINQERDASLDVFAREGRRVLNKYKLEANQYWKRGEELGHLRAIINLAM